LLRSKDFLKKSGYFHFQEKFEEIQENILDKIKSANENNAQSDRIAHLKTKLTFLREKHEIFSQTKLKRLRERAKAATRSRLDRYAEEFVPKDGRSLIYYGDQVAFRGARGWVHTPRQHLISAFRRIERTTVLATSEFRTTKLCHSCHGELVIAKQRGHRWTYCTACKISAHRDVNAAKNIIYHGRSEHLGEPLPLPFVRPARAV
jgi:Putative transposase DNA-binding domain